MSLPDPGSSDLNSSEGSSWPMYSLPRLSYVSYTEGRVARAERLVVAHEGNLRARSRLQGARGRRLQRHEHDRGQREHGERRKPRWMQLPPAPREFGLVHACPHLPSARALFSAPGWTPTAVRAHPRPPQTLLAARRVSVPRGRDDVNTAARLRDDDAARIRPMGQTIRPARHAVGDPEGLDRRDLDEQVPAGRAARVRQRATPVAGSARRGLLHAA